MKLVVGGDIGGTKIALGAFDPTNPTSPYDTAEYAVSGDFELDVKNIIEFIMSLPGELIGIGLAVPGVINADRTDLINAANLPHWVGQGIVQRLREVFAVPVALGNDVEAQALGEAYYGHGQKQDFLQIGWGTGIGSAFVRRLGGTTHVFPAEVGHTEVSAMEELLCPCGQYDCLECYAGGAGLERFHGTPAKDLSAHDWYLAAMAMAFAVKNALTVSPVALVVFSGGIAEKQPLLLEQIDARLVRTMKVFTAPTVKLSALGANSGTIGAAALLNNP